MAMGSKDKKYISIKEDFERRNLNAKSVMLKMVRVLLFILFLVFWK